MAHEGNWRAALPGVVAAPLLHSVSGSSSSWDEVLSFGLIVGVVGVLGALAFLGGRRRKGRRRGHLRVR